MWGTWPQSLNILKVRQAVHLEQGRFASNWVYPAIRDASGHLHYILLVVETLVLAGSKSGDADVNHQGKGQNKRKPYFTTYESRKGASKLGVSPDLGPMRWLQRRVHYQ